MRHFPMIAALLLVGCASAAPRPPQSAEMGLQQTSAAWTESFKSRDPDQIIPFFTDDVIAWYPGYHQPVVGRAANREAWLKYFSARPSHPVSVESVTVAGSGGSRLRNGKVPLLQRERSGGDRWPVRRHLETDQRTVEDRASLRSSPRGR